MKAGAIIKDDAWYDKHGAIINDDAWCDKCARFV
jgi:hypothetical protein